MKNLYEKSIALPQQRWEMAAQTIEGITPLVRKALSDAGFEADADEFETDMILAYTAIMYVAEFAADKCRVVSEEDI